MIKLFEKLKEVADPEVVGPKTLWEMGHAAFPSIDNPFPEGSRDHEEWQKGNDFADWGAKQW
jgi:hypothetical protein